MFNDEKNIFILETCNFWGEKYKKELSVVDAKEIITNTNDFFSVLFDCAERKRARKVGEEP